MIVHCPNCKTRYNLTPRQLGPEGRKVRCVKCAHEWFQPVNMPEEPRPQQQTPPAEPEAPAAETATSAPQPQQQAAQTAPKAEYNPPLPPENPQTKSSVERDVAQSKAQMRRRMLMGAAASVGFLLVMIAAIILLQKPLVGAIPALQGAYSAVGLSQSAEQPQQRSTTGLIVSDVQRALAEDDGITVLIFTGIMTNTTNVDVQVQAPRVHLFNERGVELDSFPALPQKKYLRPGEETQWICRFFDPPLDQISEYRITFPEQDVVAPSH